MRRLGLILIFLIGWLASLAPAVAARTVIIDAGHGGHDRGGIPGQKYSEKMYALDVAKRLERILRAKGYRTVMTRSSDTFVGLGQRCAIANRHRGAIFVSIHFNSDRRGTGIGIETYYYGSSSARLGSAIHREVVRTARTPDRGLRRRGFYVLRNTKIPAVLCELGFLTHRTEGAKIAKYDSYRQSLAEAVARGIMARY